MNIELGMIVQIALGIVLAPFLFFAIIWAVGALFVAAMALAGMSVFAVPIALAMYGMGNSPDEIAGGTILGTVILSSIAWHYMKKHPL